LINNNIKAPFGAMKGNMKEVIILAILVITTLYATFAESAIRRICTVELDNGTITKTHENCRLKK